MCIRDRKCGARRAAQPAHHQRSRCSAAASGHRRADPYRGTGTSTALVNQLCRCAAAGGVVSIMTGNARAMAVRPALERRWDDAVASLDARGEIGVLGVPGRADTVEELSELVRSRGVEPMRWYGVWLFVDWLDFCGAELDPSDSKQVAGTAAVELQASRRDPYRQLSRVFHLVGRRTETAVSYT